MIHEEILHSLEFDKILAVVAGFANSDATRKAVQAIVPLASRAEIETRFGQVEEVRRLARLGISLPLAPFEDIAELMALVRPEGAVLNPSDLVPFIPVLRIMAAIARQFGYRTDIPLLRELAGHVTGFPHILEPLEASLDSEGNILDTASKLLFEIRTTKRALTARIRKRLEEIVREKQTAIFLQDDFITLRGGRYVIPVRMDSKGMVQGVVHDVSNSGETAFMEPLEIIGLANELENLVAEEKAEMIRILREICRSIREEADELEIQFTAVVQLDLVNGIARFANLIGAEVPVISDQPVIRLREARHSLLMLLQRERGGREVVPLDLELGTAPDAADISAGQGAPSNLMVITGPNAGGKTIALKTTGLLLAMALSGIPVSAAATSVFPLVDQLLVDIGDEQSIEASLSTFSAHIANIARILAGADGKTLVLLDELGTGTEPGQGAAIACAVLQELQEQGALVLATTHLTDIVGFVHRTPGMVNAAMEFDPATYSPLYRLKAGEPGQSHAIEIARRYGLPERVIAVAQGMVGRLDTEFHALLAELKEKSHRHDEALAELAQRDRELAGKERLLGERLAAAEVQRRETVENALQEAREIVQNARREMNVVIEEARAERRREARQRLDEAERQVEERLREMRPEAYLDLDLIAEGDVVFVRSLGCDATVAAVDRKRGRFRVRAGQLELEVDLADAAPRTGKGAPSKEARRRAAAEETLSRELNIVGLRVDDALPEVERFLNRASLEGLGEVRIIHGKGTGALMRAVRTYLDGHPLVREFRKGEPFEGGEGATVVTLG